MDPIKEKIEILYALKEEHTKIPETKIFGLYYVTQTDKGLTPVITSFSSLDPALLGIMIGSNRSLVKKLFGTGRISFNKPANLPNIIFEGEYIRKFSELDKEEQEHMVSALEDALH